MRLFLALLLLVHSAVALAAGRRDVSVAEVAIGALPGWTPVTAPRPERAPLQAIVGDPGAGGLRPRATRLLGFQKGDGKAVVLYLEYGSEREATRALSELRGRLWGGDAAPAEGPRILRAANVVAVIESPTLSVALQVSRKLAAAAGAVQDAADVPAGASDDPPPPRPPEPLALPTPTPIDAPSAQVSDPSLQSEVMAGLGKHLEASTTAGQLLRDKRYPEALAAYQRLQQQVDGDAAATDLARWDAASGVGLAAAFSGQMAEARAAFTRAVKPASKLDPRKLAETLFNLACAEAELGRKVQALAVLKGCLAAAHRAGPDRVAHYRQSIATDNSLRSLRGDPRLKKLLAGK